MATNKPPDEETEQAVQKDEDERDERAKDMKAQIDSLESPLKTQPSPPQEQPSPPQEQREPRPPPRPPARPTLAARIWAWGFNAEGQLGDATRDTRGNPEQIVWTPTADITAVSAGAYHNLAQLADGTVWAWGSQDWYQCGQPEYVDQLTPAKVLDLEEVVAISAGGWHSLARLLDGTVRAWGADNEGQRGVGSKSANAYSPPATVVGLQEVTAISAGGLHSLALLRDGTVRAWGSQDWYQVGNPAWVDKTQPTDVLELSQVTAVSAGGWHSLALLDDGTVRGWGANNYGQLGGGTTWGNQYRAPVQAVDLDGVKAVATGSQHSLALRDDGTVWAWGANGWGQVGDGTNQHRNRPVQVVGLEGVKAIAAGPLQDWSHHSLALREDGTLWAWGYNGYGQLGDGTTQSRNRPEQVMGVKGVSVFDAGGCHTIAIA